MTVNRYEEVVRSSGALRRRSGIFGDLRPLTTALTTDGELEAGGRF